MFQVPIVTRKLCLLGRSACEEGWTIRWRMVLWLPFLLSWGVPNTYAQREFEVNPFFGARYGGNIDVTRLGNPNADYFKIKSSENYGVLTDISIWRNLQGEFIWNRQPTSLTTHNPNNGTYTFLSKMNLDSCLFGLTYQFRESKMRVRPFASVSFGFSHYGVPPVNGQPVLNFTNREALNLAAGVKYFFTRNFGMRMEARWALSDSTYKGTDNCVPLPLSGPCDNYNGVSQWQANIGLTFRYK